MTATSGRDNRFPSSLWRMKWASAAVPCREALLMFVQEGLVTHSPNRGFSVVEFTANDLVRDQPGQDSIGSCRAEMAKSYLAQGDFEELERLKKVMVETHSVGQISLCGQADMAFHGLIWDRTGNTRLAATLRHLLAPMFAYGSLFSIGRPDMTPSLLAEEHDVFIRFLSGRASVRRTTAFASTWGFESKGGNLCQQSRHEQFQHCTRRSECWSFLRSPEPG